MAKPARRGRKEQRCSSRKVPIARSINTTKGTDGTNDNADGIPMAPISMRLLQVLTRRLVLLDALLSDILLSTLALLIEKELELRIVERLSSFSKTNL